MILLSGCADEHNLSSVGRPARKTIAFCARGQIMYSSKQGNLLFFVCGRSFRLRCRIARESLIQIGNEIADCDKAVRLTVNAKRDSLAVRRPLRPRELTANVRKLLRSRSGLSVHGSQPEFVLRLPNGIASIGRDLDVFATLLLASHVAEQMRLAIVHCSRPHLLLRLRCETQRIRRPPCAVQLRAVRIDDAAAVRRQLERRDSLSIITGVVRDLAPDIPGCSRNPNVVRSLVVKDPGNDISVTRRRKLRWKRRTHHLFQGETLAEGCDGNENGGEKKGFKRFQIVISGVSAFQEFRMILAEITYAKIAATKNERDTMFGAEVLFHSDGCSESAGSGRFSKNLRALQQQRQCLHGFLVGNDSDTGEMFLCHCKRRFGYCRRAERFRN